MGRKGGLHQTKSISGKAARMDRIVIIWYHSSAWKPMPRLVLSLARSNTNTLQDRPYSQEHKLQ